MRLEPAAVIFSKIPYPSIYAFAFSYLRGFATSRGMIGDLNIPTIRSPQLSPKRQVPQ
jgi:hypothetical protein